MIHSAIIKSVMPRCGSERLRSGGVRLVRLVLGVAMLAGGSVAAHSADPEGRVLRVGPDAQYTAPSEAAQAARDGDLILIEAGVYEGDVATWRADNLTIRGVGGQVVLDAAGRSAGGKAIWVINGNNTVVESITFTGAAVPDRNGAGIRDQSLNLTIRDCVFHHNEMGILTYNNPKARLTIIGSEFYANGVRVSGSSNIGHNIYVNRIGRFTLRGSYFHHAIVGHQVKTRARYNRIQYNRITDEDESHGSYLIDVPNGGTAIIMGNVLRQNKRTENWHLISFGAEGARSDSSFAVVYNTMINAAPDGVFVTNPAEAPGIVANNLLVGSGMILDGPGRKAGNIKGDASDFVNLDALNVALTPGAAAIDKSVSLSLEPRSEYVHPRGLRDRQMDGVPDAGAYEYQPQR